MKFVRHIVGLIVAILITALSAVAMPMMPTASHQAEFFPLQPTVVAEHTDVHFATRAPPLTGANVAFIGAVVAEHGNGFVMHGHETHVASLDSVSGFDATNSTFDFTTSGTCNDLRRFTTLDGTDVRIKSGHAYNRTHAGGDVSQTGTMDEIENAILRDISANSKLGSLQPRTTQTHIVQVNGQTVGYSLADTTVGANINYYPVIE